MRCDNVGLVAHRPGRLASKTARVKGLAERSLSTQNVNRRPNLASLRGIVMTPLVYLLAAQLVTLDAGDPPPTSHVSQPSDRDRADAGPGTAGTAAATETEAETATETDTASGALGIELPTLVTHEIKTPLVIDGSLDEEAWHTAPIIDGLRQVEPNNGEPARQRTVVKVLFDQESLYVGAILFDDEAKDNLRVPDVQRDFDESDRDYFGVILDTLNDERNAFAFLVNPYGALRDLQAFDDDNYDKDWDALWRANTTRHDDRWVVEMAIEWKTLRYAPGTKRMGMQIVRSIKRLNEIDGWSPWTRQFSAYRMTYAGNLEGLEPPAPALNLLVRPFATLASSLTDPNDALRPNVGGDIRWVPLPNLTVDLTGNTDFAEVDVDRQVVNLSRFSILFPERRQFFLESASLFSTST